MDTIRACCAKKMIIYKIDHITGNEKCELLEMGFVRNAEIEIVKESHNSGLIIIKIKNTNYALRHETAYNIHLIPL